jgi:hypothetical protein
MGWDLLRNEQQQLVSSTVVVCGERSTRGGRASAWTTGVGAVQGQFGDRTTHGQSYERSVRSPCVFKVGLYRVYR